ncbi:MAG: enoyl-CoA hydratase/isomerase family protein [Desulfobacterales bacterium]
MEYRTLLYETQGDIGILTYNRPDMANAMNSQMVEDLIHFWQERMADQKTRVIITTGAGEKAFSSGADLKETGDIQKDKDRMTIDNFFFGQSRFSFLYRLMRSCPQPIIAAVNGPALGGGLSLALASDIRLAGENAWFCAQYINIGLGGADMGSSYFLWRLVGWGNAIEMCLTGRRVNCDEAHRIGLVNHVYPQGELMDKAMEMAGVMAAKSRSALYLTKEAFDSALNGISLEDAIKMENRNQALLMGTLNAAKQW